MKCLTNVSYFMTKNCKPLFCIFKVQIIPHYATWSYAESGESLKICPSG